VCVCVCLQTAFMDLVDVFAVPPDVSHHSTNPWGDVAPQGAAPAPVAGLTAARDPWDSLGESRLHWLRPYSLTHTLTHSLTHSLSHSLLNI